MDRSKPTPGFPPSPEFLNSFVGGMKTDRDILDQDPKTYTYSLAGRLLYNKSGNYSWTNEDGTKHSFDLPTGYDAIGSREFADQLIILSTNNTNSEIGGLRIDGKGNFVSYTQYFNDEFDPNGELFGWKKWRKFASIIPCEESPTITRIYGTERWLEPIAFNAKLGLQSVSPEFTNGDYQPIAGNIYPWFYSVHAWHYQADIFFGRIKLTGTSVAGSLKTGAYQIAYQGMTRDGYTTPFSILTRRFLCTYDETKYGNSHDRVMQASNQYSAHGFSFKIENIDKRFWKVRVAYVYSIDENAPVEANIFDEIEISDQSITDLNFDLITNGGKPVSLGEFNKKIISIKRCQTMQQKDNRLWLGGVETYGDFNPFLDNAAVNNFDWTVTQDTLGAVQNVPLTDSAKATSNIPLNAFTNNDTTIQYDNIYDINNDYVNFKGIQVEHLLRSYLPNEVYPIEFLAVDIKGCPYWSINIQDKQIGNFTPAIGNGTGALTSQGIEVSGIDITKIIYDPETGKQKLGGFAIVRPKRVPSVLFQSVMFPTVWNLKNDDEKKKTYLLPMPSNLWGPKAANSGENVLGYDTSFQFDSSNIWNSRPYTFLMHSPELSFGYPVFKGTNQNAVTDADILKLIFAYGSTYQNNTNAFNRLIELLNDHGSFYTKNYNDAGAYPFKSQNFGDKSSLRFLGLSGLATAPDTPKIITGYDPNDTSLDFYFMSQMFNNAAYGTELFSFGVDGGWLIKAKDYINLDINDTPNTDPAYFIAEYRVNNKNYYNNDNVINRRLCMGTGHYQPLTPQVISDATQPGNNNKVIFDEIQLFGGDVFPTLFEFTRLYPKYSGTCNKTSGIYTDYAVGLIVPLFSRINCALRKGRFLSNVGIQPEATGCGDDNVFEDGVFTNQPEESNINSVTLLEENVQFFPSKPNDKDVDKTIFPYRWCYSTVKFQGEKEDHYREILADNFGDVQGVYGKIVGSFFLFDAIYCLQEMGFCRLRINERTVLSTATDEAVQTGVGETFGLPEYISTEHGCVHPFSITQSDRAAYWGDQRQKTICRFAQDGLTELPDVAELHNEVYDLMINFDEDFISDGGVNKATEHIHSTFDDVNEELIMTFIKIKSDGTPEILKTLVFNENPQVNAFVTYQPYVPYIYLNHKGYNFSSDPSSPNKIYLHGAGDKGNFYGVIHNSILEFIINPGTPDDDVENRFDNEFGNINLDGANALVQIVMTDDYQTQTQGGITETRTVYRNGILNTPLMQRDQNKRLQGKSLRLRFTFDNSNNKVIKWTTNRVAYRRVRKIR